MRKSLGSKRKWMTADHVARVVGLYKAFEEGDHVRIFDNADFGYTKVTVERPLRNAKGEVVRDRAGSAKADGALRDTERVPLKDDVDGYFDQEVRPHVPDAWMDRGKDKVGYEINFSRYFYKYTPLRSVDEIAADIRALDAETEGALHAILSDLRA